MNDNNFKFFLPAEIEKATSTSGKEEMRVKGIASTSSQDSQGEYLDPSSMDLSEFKWINWNHHGSKDPGTIIGEPTKAVVNEKNQLYIEGMLYDEVPMAKTTWGLMKALNGSPSGNKLSLSVEGKVTQRASSDKNDPLYNKILKCKITGVAICPVPVNGDTWVDFLKKGYTNDSEEEYDDETKKAMTAEAGENVTSKESVETANDKKPIPSLEGTPELVLKKSDVYEKIFEKFPGIELEKAKSVYKLIEKTAETMDKKINDETISKALDILDLASADVLAKSEKTITNSKKDPSEEDEDKDEKEMVEKASTIVKSMSAESKDDLVIKAALVNKGFGEKIIEKAMTSKTNPVYSGISKAEIEDLMKSNTSMIMASFDKKFTAVGTLLKTTIENNEVLQKSLDDTLAENKELTGKMESFLKTSTGSRSLLTKSYQDRFGDAKEGGDAKPSNQYNINNKNDRNLLKNKLTEMSNINKGENIDERFVRMAKNLEIAGMLEGSDITLLKSVDIEVVGS